MWVVTCVWWCESGECVWWHESGDDGGGGVELLLLWKLRRAQRFCCWCDVWLDVDGWGCTIGIHSSHGPVRMSFKAYLLTYVQLLAGSMDHRQKLSTVPLFCAIIVISLQLSFSVLFPLAARCFWAFLFPYGFRHCPLRMSFKTLSCQNVIQDVLSECRSRHCIFRMSSLLAHIQLDFFIYLCWQLFVLLHLVYPLYSLGV